MHAITLRLYGTSGCHLCDDALIEINSAIEPLSATLNIHLSEIDIIEDDSLYDQYQTKIPVLTIDIENQTKMLCWPFNQQVVEAIIRKAIKKPA